MRSGSTPTGGNLAGLLVCNGLVYCTHFLVVPIHVVQSTQPVTPGVLITGKLV